METHYCWRCRCDMPMLDEPEWAEVGVYLDRYGAAIKDYRADHPGVGLSEGRARVADLACTVYERLTGVPETNHLAIYHHRRSLYGPPCGRCGRLLRTPQASFCAACGWRPESTSAE